MYILYDWGKLSDRSVQVEITERGIVRDNLHVLRHCVVSTVVRIGLRPMSQTVRPVAWLLYNHVRDMPYRAMLQQILNAETQCEN